VRRCSAAPPARRLRPSPLLTTLGFVRLQIIFNMPNNCQKQHESKKKVGAKAAVKTEESKARTDPTVDELGVLTRAERKQHAESQRRASKAMASPSAEPLTGARVFVLRDRPATASLLQTVTALGGQEAVQQFKHIKADSRTRDIMTSTAEQRARSRRLGGATACYPAGHLGREALGLGCSTHSGTPDPNPIILTLTLTLA
jgi:hypothetical protein